MSTLAKAIRVAATAFENKSDKGGHPYILHCLYVMNQMPDDEDLQCIAVLHDLIEDTSYTEDDLFQMGFSMRVCQGVSALTHLDDVPYDDYIRSISMSKDATLVKLADLKHNSDIHRMKGLRRKDFDRLEKYHRAYMYLKN